MRDSHQAQVQFAMQCPRIAKNVFSQETKINSSKCLKIKPSTRRPTCKIHVLSKRCYMSNLKKQTAWTCKPKWVYIILGNSKRAPLLNKVGVMYPVPTAGYLCWNLRCTPQTAFWTSAWWIPNSCTCLQNQRTFAWFKWGFILEAPKSMWLRPPRRSTMNHGEQTLFFSSPNLEPWYSSWSWPL